MSVGFLVAGGVIAAVDQPTLGGASLLAGVLLVGVPILDTSLVVLSRRRAGVSVLTGGRDHLTHRLLLRLESPRRVAMVLAMTQALLCGAAVPRIVALDSAPSGMPAVLDAIGSGPAAQFGSGAGWVGLGSTPPTAWTRNPASSGGSSGASAWSITRPCASARTVR